MKRTIIDQLNRKVEINEELKNIVSLVPSLTELLFFFGMEGKIKGITSFCSNPPEKVKFVKTVGGPITINYEIIDEISPDLIIAGKSENNKEQIEHLSSKYPVWVSDVKSLEDAFKMIEKIGVICNKSELAYNITQNLSVSFDLLSEKTNIKVAYLVWEKPFIVAGNNTFVNDILKKTGFINVFKNLEGYPKVTAKELNNCNADFVLLPSEPYPFENHHIDSYKSIIPGAKILLVDGQLFSWYGNRLLVSVNYFKNIKRLMRSLQDSIKK